jgi:hypothetical protein
MALLVFALGFVLRAQLSEASGLPMDLDPPIDVDTPGARAMLADSGTEIARAPRRFELARIGARVVKEFQRAWTISNNGTSGKEGLVLLFQGFDGGYLARVQRKTNELRQVTFTWVPNAIAVVHTHPNRNDPRPSTNDMELADRLKVPMITITLHGMFVYDPATKQTTRVFDGLDWLDSSNWARKAGWKMPAVLSQRYADSSRRVLRLSPQGFSLGESKSRLTNGFGGSARLASIVEKQIGEQRLYHRQQLTSVRR